MRAYTMERQCIHSNNHTRPSLLQSYLILFICGRGGSNAKLRYLVPLFLRESVKSLLSFSLLEIDAASLAARQTPCRSLTSGSNWGVAPVPRPMMASSGGHHLPLPRSNEILGSNTDAAASPSSLVCPRVAQGRNPTAAAFQGKNASTLSPPAQALAQPGPHGGSAQLALWQPTSCPCPYAGCTHAEEVEFSCRQPTRAAAAQPLPAPSAEQEAMLHLAQQSAPPTSSASLWHQRPSAPSPRAGSRLPRAWRRLLSSRPG